MKTKILIITLLTLFFTLGCNQKKEAKKLQILVCPQGLVHSFWITVKSGADSAAKEINADIIWKGPAIETDIAGQISIIEDYINKKVDAIVIAACDSKALIPALQKAAAAKIPVITIGSGVDSDVALSFIATDNVAGAGQGAKKLAELISDKGDVACVPFVPGAGTSEMRERGFKNEIARHQNIKIVATQYSQSEVATGMAVTEDILTSNRNLAGIFGANEASTIGIVQGLKSKNRLGTVKVVGFDASENELAELKAGNIDALVAQDPFKMGYLGVKSAFDVINGRKIEKRIDTGVYLITRENINDPEIQKLLSAGR